jgi:hypothetical protein
VREEIVDLGFRARPWQVQALASLKRFSVLIVHRGGGKTLAAVMKLIDAALRCKDPAARYAYVAPELKQAKTAAWTYLCQYARKLPQHLINESELWVQLPNGARIRIFGADDPDKLRGQHLYGIVLDEVAQMKPHVWGEVLLPALASHDGWCLFIGTPKGTNLLSETYFKAEADSSWFAGKYTIADTNVYTPEQLAAIRANQTDNQWRQEMLCDFDASSEETLISIDLVRAAMGRHLPEAAFNSESRVMGVDIALGGGDRTVIQRRQGLAAFPPHIIDTADPHQIGDLVAHHIDVFHPDAVFIDDSGGYGSGVISRLRGLNYGAIVQPVQFGWSALDERFVNRAAEMWWKIRVWLEAGGSLPKDQRYLLELSSRQCDHSNARGKMALETKDQMRARGIKSPDIADALALTFASPVAVTNRMIRGLPAQVTQVYQGTLSGAYVSDGNLVPYPSNQHLSSYDPWEKFAQEQKREHG